MRTALLRESSVRVDLFGRSRSPDAKHAFEEARERLLAILSALEPIVQGTASDLRQCSSHLDEAAAPGQRSQESFLNLRS